MAGSKHTKNYCWWIERKQLALATTNNGKTFNSPSESGLSVRIYATCYPTLFTVDNATPQNLSVEIPDFPDQFTQAIIAKISAWLYEDSQETLQLAQYYDAKYNEYIKDAKAYAGSERIDQSSYGIKPYDF